MRLPDNTDLARVIPDGTASVVEGPSGIGQDIAALGGGLQRVSDRRSAYDTAKAQAGFLKAKTIQDNAFDQDRDYETIPERYEESVREAMEEAAKNIRNPRARAKFLENNDVLIQGGIEAMQAKAFGVEKDEARASVNEQLNDLNAVGLTGDPVAALKAMEDLLAGGVEAGYYSAEDAGKVDRGWRDTFAANKVASMPADKRIEALSQPWAANLPPATRMRLMDEAEVDARREKAVEVVDGFMARGLDLGQMRKEIRSIEDTKLRKEVEARRDYEFQQRETARVEDQDQVFEKYGMQVRTGEIRVQDIPRAELDFLDQNQIDALERIEAGRLSGTKITTSRQEYATIYDLLDAGQPDAALKHLYDNAAAFDDTDFESLRGKISTARKSESGDEIKSIRSDTVAVNDALMAAGIKASPENKGELRKAYDDWQMEFQRREGREPSAEERDRQLGSMAAQIKLRKPGMFNDKTHPAHAHTKAGYVPEEYVAAVLQGMDFDPNDKTVVKDSAVETAYSAARAYLLGQGVPTPTPHLMEQAVRERPWEGPR